MSVRTFPCLAIVVLALAAASGCEGTTAAAPEGGVTRLDCQSLAGSWPADDPRWELAHTLCGAVLGYGAECTGPEDSCGSKYLRCVKSSPVGQVPEIFTCIAACVRNSDCAPGWACGDGICFQPRGCSPAPATADAGGDEIAPPDDGGTAADGGGDDARGL